MQTFIINSQEVKVEVVEDKIFTNSLHVSKVFAKQHKDVMRTIQDFPDEFNRRNFTPSFYLDKLKREQPLYNLTRDGFSMLVMGFTGKKAFEWKVEFIKAFNKMEELLHLNPLHTLSTTMTAFIKAQNQTNTILLKNMELQTKLLQNLLTLKDETPKTITKEQMKLLRGKIHIIAALVSECHPQRGEADITRQLYTELNARMGVSSYYDIAREDFEEAMNLQQLAITHWEEKRDLLLKREKLELEKDKQKMNIYE